MGEKVNRSDPFVGEGLKELIESGYGLGDSTVEPEQAGAEGASKQKVDATRNAPP